MKADVFKGAAFYRTSLLVLNLQVLAVAVVRKLMDKLFTQRELEMLDDVMPEIVKRAKQDQKKMAEEEAIVAGVSKRALKFLVCPSTLTLSALLTKSTVHNTLLGPQR